MSEFLTRLLNIDVRFPWNGEAMVTPEDAGELLRKHNVGNRRLRTHFVAHLRREIENGEWQPDHPQPIVFTTSGVLIDGQHRLHAIASAKVSSVVVGVRCGVREELKRYIDTGVPRMLEDRVEFVPDRVLNGNVSRILNFLFSIVTSADGTLSGVSKSAKLTPADAMELFEAHRAGILFAAQRYARQRGLVVAVYVALAQYYELNHEKAEEFADSLLAPDGQIQQARRLRDHLLTRRDGGGYAANIGVYRRAIGAMKAHYEGRQLSAIRQASW